MVKFEIFLSREGEFLKDLLNGSAYGSWLELKTSAPEGVYFDFTGELTRASIEVERTTMRVTGFPLAYRQPDSQDNYRQVGVVRVLHE